MAFTGQLRSNEIFAALYNMIISQQVFADNLKGTNSTLADKMRVDGGLAGDTKLYYATNCLSSVEWMNDAEAANLLELERPEAPEVQAIYIDKFRQIRLTVDNYLSKRAWSDEGTFSSFNSVMLGWIRDTKKVYDSKLVNVFACTTETNIGKQEQTITVNEGDNFGLITAEKLANILVDLKEADYDYNDYGFIRSYDESDFIVIWNAEVYNAIKKVDLPVVYHINGLLGEFEQQVLPAKYFGETFDETGTGTTTANNTTIRSLIEKKYQVASAAAHPRAVKAKDGNFYVNCFPGDLLPNSVSYDKTEVYTQKDDIAFKVIHKRSIPFMSAFEVGTSFFNPRSLTETHYLTFSHNTLDYLKNYPFITVKVIEA